MSFNIEIVSSDSESLKVKTHLTNGYPLTVEFFSNGFYVRKEHITTDRYQWSIVDSNLQFKEGDFEFTHFDGNAQRQIAWTRVVIDWLVEKELFHSEEIV
jgi:hypothetical protein